MKRRVETLLAIAALLVIYGAIAYPKLPDWICLPSSCLITLAAWLGGKNRGLQIGVTICTLGDFILSGYPPLGTWPSPQGWNVPLGMLVFGVAHVFYQRT